jgi:hypothetical protein
MVPDFNVPPPKEEEVVPDINELVDNKADQLAIRRLVLSHVDLGKEIKELADQRDKITGQLKVLLSQYKVQKAVSAGCRISYYGVPRSTLDKGLLLNHGVSPKVIEECTVTKISATLRVTGPEDADATD